jgi:hypothetical protein
LRRRGFDPQLLSVIGSILQDSFTDEVAQAQLKARHGYVVLVVEPLLLLLLLQQLPLFSLYALDLVCLRIATLP